jgi:hypothetical protein
MPPTVRPAEVAILPMSAHRLQRASVRLCRLNGRSEATSKRR